MSEDIPPSLFKIIREDLANLNARFDSFATNSVSQAFIVQMQTNQKERDDRQDARIRDLENDLETEKKARRDELAEARRVKAQQWFAIGSAILTGVIAIIGGVIVWTITQGLQQAIPGVVG